MVTSSVSIPKVDQFGRSAKYYSDAKAAQEKRTASRLAKERASSSRRYVAPSANIPRVSTSQAESQVKEARGQLEFQRTQAGLQRKSLQESRKALPITTSQRALRQTMAGLRGRDTRRQVAKVGKQISTEQVKVQEFEKELTKFETKQIKPVERQIKEAKEYNRAAKTIERAAEKGKVWAHAMYGSGLVKKLAKEYEKQRKLQQRAAAVVATVAAPEVKVPTAKVSTTPTAIKFTPAKVDKRPGDIYLPDRGIVARATYPSGQGTISTVRSMTPQEISLYEKRQKNILTADISTIKQNIKDIKRIDTQLESRQIQIKQLEKGRISSVGEFTGTEAEFKKLQSLTEAYNRDVQRYSDKSTIGVGLIGGGRQRDIREFDVTERPVSASAKIITATLGETAAKATQKGLDVIGYKTKVVPEKEMKVYTEQYGTPQTNILTGKPESFYKEGSITMPSRTITSESIGRSVGKTVEAVGDVGKYFIPVAGTAIFAGEVVEYGAGVSKTLSSGQALTKEQKIEGAVLGTVLLTAGTIKAAGTVRQITKPIISTVKTAEGSKTIVTTPLQKFMGQRVRVDRRGIDLLPSERYIAKIEKRKIQPKTKPVEDIFLIEKVPTKVSQVGEAEVSLFKDVKGFGRQVEAGEKTVITLSEGSKARQFLEKKIKIDRTGVSISKPDKIIFKGLSPATKAGRAERDVASKYLSELGISQRQTSELLRLRRPAIRESRFKGDVLIVQTPKQKATFLEGQRETTYVEEFVGGIKTKGGTGEFSKVKATGEPYIAKGQRLLPERLGIEGDKTKLSLQRLKVVEETGYLTKEGREFAKLSKGKEEKVSDLLSISKKVSDRELGGFKAEIYKDASVGESKGMFGEKFKQFEVEKTFETGRGTVIVKGEKVERNILQGFTRDEAKSKRGMETFLKGAEKRAAEEKLLLAKEPKFIQVKEVKAPEISPAMKESNRLFLEAKEAKFVAGKEEAELLSSIKLTEISPAMKEKNRLFLEAKDVAAEVKKSKVTPFSFDVAPSKQSTPFTSKAVVSQAVQPVSISAVTPVSAQVSAKAEQIMFEQKSMQQQAQKSLKKEAVKQAQKSLKKTSFKQMFETLRATATKPVKTTKPTTTTFTPRVVIKPKSQPSAKDMIKEISTGKFGVFVKRKGVDVEIGKAETKREARAKLFGELREEISASGFVEVGGRKVGLELGQGFRRSKVDKFRIVERKERRIKRGTREAPTIQSFRRSNKVNDWFQ